MSCRITSSGALQCMGGSIPRAILAVQQAEKYICSCACTIPGLDHSTRSTWVRESLYLLNRPLIFLASSISSATASGTSLQTNYPLIDSRPDDRRCLMWTREFFSVLTHYFNHTVHLHTCLLRVQIYDTGKQQSLGGQSCSPSTIPETRH